MAMEEVLDAARSIIHKWVNTETPIVEDVSVGDTELYVFDTQRFSITDDIMLINADSFCETGLKITQIDRENNVIHLSEPVANSGFSVLSGTCVRKLLNDQFVQGIYIGGPEVIFQYPAITVEGDSKQSEWFTLETSKERYEITVTVYVQASTHEKGYRFLQKVTDTIVKGLKMNIVPLVGPYDITSLDEDAFIGDVDIALSDRDLVNFYRRIFIENTRNCQENLVSYVYPEDDDPDGKWVRLKDGLSCNFSTEDTNVVVMQRSFYNSWPSDVQYGHIHRKELLRAAKISWFCEETEQQFPRKGELKLN